MLLRGKGRSRHNILFALSVLCILNQPRLESIQKKISSRSGQMAHSCNPSHSGGRAQLEASLDKKFSRPHLQQQKLGVMVLTCHPSYTGSISRRITVQASLA
jgi:hypothetical protein